MKKKASKKSPVKKKSGAQELASRGLKSVQVPCTEAQHREWRVCAAYAGVPMNAWLASVADAAAIARLSQHMAETEASTMG